MLHHLTAGPVATVAISKVSLFRWLSFILNYILHVQSCGHFVKTVPRSLAENKRSFLFHFMTQLRRLWESPSPLPVLISSVVSHINSARSINISNHSFQKYHHVSSVLTKKDLKGPEDILKA